MAGRLHWASVFFAVWRESRSILPIVVIALVVGGLEALLRLGWLVIPIGIVFVVQVARFLSLTWAVTGHDVVLRSGIVSRTERHVPFDRVQDLRLEQGVLHRLLRVATVHVETAGGGQGAEASLAVLSLPQAERLRDAVSAGARQAKAQRSAARGEAPALESPVRVLHRVGSLELAWGGLLGTRLTPVLVMLGFGFAILDDVVPNVEQRLEALLESEAERLEATVSALGPSALLVAAVAAVVGVIALAALLSTIVSVVVFHGFRLTLQGDDLSRRYGLLTRRQSSYPRRRVQVLAIQERLFRRLGGLATLRADTAGSPVENARQAGSDVLVPIVRQRRVPPLLAEIFPDLPSSEPAWQRVSPLAILRATRKAALLCLLLVGLLALQWLDPLVLTPLLAVPLAWVVARVKWRHVGWAHSAGFFHTRRGWLSRVTHVVPVRNVQSVILRQTPFDRRLGLATLVIDTAGQANTGGGPRIDNVPLDEALRVGARLAREAASLRYRW